MTSKTKRAVRCFACILAVLGSVSPALPQATAPLPADDGAASPPLAQSAEVMKDEGASLPGVDDPLEGREPYKSWKHHSGEAKDAVVLVRSGSGKVFSGVVLRCDGFLLVPQGVYGEIDSRAVRVEVAVAPTGTEPGDNLEAPLPVAGRLHTGADYRVEYGLIKVNDHHLRSLRPLAAWNLKAGTPLRVVYAAPHPSDISRCVPVTWEATAGAPLLDDRTGQFWSLEGLKPAEGADPASPAASLPAGAAVIDAESGALIGMVTRPGAAPVFSSLSRMGEQISEVGIAPSRAALKQASNPNSPARIEGTDPGTGRWRQGEMVRVAGGPVLLGGASAAAFRKAYRTDVVCTLDFYIDVYPVSLKEYRAWLLARPSVASPRSWGADERRTPERRQDLPATGMNLREAGAYATDRDARLVTEVEWLRASRLSALAVSQVESEVRSQVLIQSQLVELVTWLETVLKEVAAMMEAAGGRQSASGSRVAGAVAADQLPGHRESLLSSLNRVLASIGQYLGQTNRTDWMHMPRTLNPLDANDADVSLYGVRHVAMNAPEMLLPRGLRGALAPKALPAYMDPYISRTRASWNLFLLGTVAGLGPGEFLPTSGGFNKRVIDLTPDNSLGWAALFHGATIEGYATGGRPGGAHFSSFHFIMGPNPAIDAGFRCAR